MRNPCLEVALGELSRAGVRDIVRSFGGRHMQLRWSVDGGPERMYVLPLTPSDHRSPANVRAGVRRLLRQDGLLGEQAKKIAITPKPANRLIALEGRVAALERTIKQLVEQLTKGGFQQ